MRACMLINGKLKHNTFGIVFLRHHKQIVFKNSHVWNNRYNILVLVIPILKDEHFHNLKKYYIGFKLQINVRREKH